MASLGKMELSSPPTSDNEEAVVLHPPPSPAPSLNVPASVRQRAAAQAARTPVVSHKRYTTQPETELAVNKTTSIAYVIGLVCILISNYTSLLILRQITGGGVGVMLGIVVHALGLAGVPFIVHTYTDDERVMYRGACAGIGILSTVYTVMVAVL